MNYPILLLLLLALVMGGVAVWLLLRGQLGRLLGEADRLNEVLAVRETECRQLREQVAEAQQREAVLAQKLSSTEEAYEHERKSRSEEFARQIAFVREQMQNEMRELVEQKSRTLSATNRESIELILKPYQDKLQELGQLVSAAREKQIETSSALGRQMEDVMRNAQRLGEEADKLARALRNEVKTQGNLGETMLRLLLERSGLEEGVGFEMQVTLRDKAGKTIHNEEGRRMVPDAAVHFPGGRTVLIDSKTQRAYGDYQNATTDDERNEALRRHVESVRTQVKELAAKNYTAYTCRGNEVLPYLFMFIPIDAAMQLALTADPQLWAWAFEKRVFITSEQNLLLVLRLVEIAWMQQRQIDNQEEVYKIAGEMQDRIAAFLGYFEGVGDHLDAARQAYADVIDKLRDGRQSVAGSARKLEKLGAQATRKQSQLAASLARIEREEERSLES